MSVTTEAGKSGATPAILLPVSSWPDATPAAGLLRAFDTAASLGASVTAVVHEVDVPSVSSLAGDALINLTQMIAAAEQKSAASADRISAQLGALAARFHSELYLRRWRGRLDDAPQHFARLARTYDHTFLVPQPDDANQFAIAEAVLFGSGGPLWVFPPVEGAAQLRSVAVAWDGARASARAVHDALPVLALADEVTVLTVTDDKPMDGPAVETLRDYLADHGIRSVSVNLRRGDWPVGEALQDAALECGAGLLVMGGYGHSRLREFALGGATRSVLARPRLPILMSH